MKKNASSYLSMKICEYKSFIKQNKIFFIITLAFVIVGLLLALNHIGNYVQENAELSVFGKIKEGDFSYLKFELTILFVPLGLGLTIFILSFNHYAVFLSYIVVIIFSRYWVRLVITSIINDILLGILSLLLLYLPLFVIVLLFWTVFFVKTLFTVYSAPCRKRFYFEPYGRNFIALKKPIKEYLIIGVAIPFTYANLMVVTFTLIVNII